MLISELSDRTQVPVATLKYYLREGLLPAGTATSRTRASYDTTHVDRVRLIRALMESGGLSLSRVRQVLETLDGPPVDRHDLLGTAQRAITPPLPERPDDEWTQTATQFVADHGWQVDDDEPLLVLLGEQMRTLASAEPELADEALLARYAGAADALAEVDFSVVPETPADALRRVAVGTVLSDPVILTLRRLAQQGLSARLSGR
ncbi:MerR family transcriptional regulator [Flexivirga sp. B27]